MADKPAFAIVNGTVVGPDRLVEDGMVVWRDGKIRQVSRRRRLPRATQILDAEGGFITPGYIDLHVHGGGGADFMDGTPEAAMTVSRSHLKHGTTTLFPTTTTGSAELIDQMIAACREARTQFEAGTVSGPRIAGVHLYGPYFTEGKAGCHDRGGCRAPQADEYRRYFDSKMVRIATCAAELPGACDFYRTARRHRCLITCGHSDASWTEMQAAFAAGMRHVDHFWCAMSSVPSLRQRLGVPMQGSMAEFVLFNSEMSTEVIADGCHLSPELLLFAWRMKGAGRLCLVTDCNRALDMPPGTYQFGHHSAGTSFYSDGTVGRTGDGNLASSVVGMDHMVRHMHRATGASLPEVVRMASLTPAERAGIARWSGSLEPGKIADILILGRNLQVRTVIVRGQCV